MEPAVLHATLEKLGGRKHTTWQTRACTLDRDSLRWKSLTGGHAIPLTDVESTHGGRADEAAARLTVTVPITLAPIVTNSRPNHRDGWLLMATKPSSLCVANAITRGAIGRGIWGGNSLW